MHFQHGTGRKTILAVAIKKALEERRCLGIGQKKGLLQLPPNPSLPIDPVRTHLHQSASNGDARQELAGDGTGGHARRRFPRR